MTARRPRVVIVDDDPIVCAMLDRLLGQAGWEVGVAHRGAAATAMLQASAAEVVLLDLHLAHEQGLELLPQLRAIRPEACIVILTAFGTIPLAVEAMRRGADDFIEKPVDPDRLLVVLAKGRESYRLRRLAARVERIAPGEPAVIGESDAMRRLLGLAEAVARRDTTVLLGGETGTGKSLIARFLHQSSPRAAEPWVEVNCAGIQRELAESELFGYEKGAFTGATERKIGLFEAAGGGTVFLDEIGDLDLTTQAKLLHVLEERRFRRVGGLTEVQVDVRLIAATNRSLEEAILAGRFRADLFYRLNTITLEVPPLRDRREDILPLARHFLGELGSANALGISPAAERMLLGYPWPGNVRELRNVMERASILCPPGSSVLPLHLPFGAVMPSLTATTPPGVARTPSHEAPVSISAAAAEAEREALQRALRQFEGRHADAARALGVSRATLYRKLRKYGISRR